MYGRYINKFIYLSIYLSMEQAADRTEAAAIGQTFYRQLKTFLSAYRHWETD